MKYTTDGTDCHCCGHGGPDVPICNFLNYHSDGTLVDSSFSHDTGSQFFASGSSDLREVFDIEKLEKGATVDSFDLGYELAELISGPGKSAKVDLTVTSAGSGDFAAGLIFWPKSGPMSLDLRGAVPGYQFKYINGSGFVRNALVTGQQYYESIDTADASQPIPFSGVVVEFDGVQYITVAAVLIFDRCWQGLGGHSWGAMPYENPFGGATTVPPNVTTLGGNGETASGTVQNWCMDAFGGTVTRVGFVYGLTSYDGSWASRSLGNGTWTQSSFVAGLAASDCYTGRCNCNHWDITALNLTINEDSPIEFQGQTVTLTRTPGTGGPSSNGWKYTGSVTGTATAAKDVQSLTHSGGDILPDPNPTGIRAFVAATYGTESQFDFDNRVEFDPVSGLSAADLEDHLNSLPGIDVTVTCGGNVAANGGGILTITSVDDGPMNCFHLSGSVTQADGTSSAGDGFTFAPLRVTPGNTGGARSAALALTLDPRFRSAGTENATARDIRSCCNLDIDLGFLTKSWLQATPETSSSTPGPSHKPVYLDFDTSGGGGSSCLSTADKLVSYYWNGYAPKSPPPAENSITSWGWDVTITE